MAIPLLEDFDAYINFHKKQFHRPLPLFNDVEDVAPNRESIDSFIRNYISSHKDRFQQYSRLVVSRWLTSQQNFLEANKLMFGRTDNESVTDKQAREALTKEAMSTLDPINKTEYEDYLTNIQKRRDNYKSDNLKYRKDYLDTINYDPYAYRDYLHAPDTEDKAEEFLQKYFSPKSMDELNSDVNKLSRLHRYLKHLCGSYLFEDECWPTSFAIILKEYFYSEPNYKKLTGNEDKKKTQYNLSVENAFSTVLEYLKDEGPDYLETSEYRKHKDSLIYPLADYAPILSSVDHGPFISDERKLIRELEIKLHYLEIDTEYSRASAESSIIKRRDSTVRERVMLHRMWRFWQGFKHNGFYKRHTQAYTCLFQLEGIHNSLDARSIDRLISQWEKTY